MKRLFIILGVLVMVCTVAAPTFARGQGKGKGYSQAGYDRRYDNLTEEQRDQLDKLRQKFYDETAPLRTKLMSKSGELKILLRTSNPNAEKARTLQKEVNDLRGNFALERLNFQIEARKIAPDIRFGRNFGKGNNRRMRGGGMGYDRDRGGYGSSGGSWCN